MEATLTPRLLSFLIRKGYKYFLTRTACINRADAYIGIILKPVKKHPLLQKLPEPFNAYCSIIQEPVQMAGGLDNTLVTVKLGTKDFEKFEKSFN